MKIHFPTACLFHAALPYLNRGDVFHFWNATASRIRNHIDWLAPYVDFIDEFEYIAYIRNPCSDVRNKVLLTFDEGYASVYNELKPFFEARSIRPLIFLNTANRSSENRPLWFVELAMIIRHGRNPLIHFEDVTFDLRHGSGRCALYAAVTKKMMRQAMSGWDELYNHLKKQLGGDITAQWDLDDDMRCMDDHTIQEILDSGWSIGSHGVTHGPLSAMCDEQLEMELRDSKVFLENRFQVPIRSFSYPNGAYSPQALKRVADHYEIAFIAGPTAPELSRVCCPRFSFPDQLYELQAHLFDRVRMQEEDGMWKKTAISSIRVSDKMVNIFGTSEGGEGAPSSQSKTKSIVILCGPNAAEKCLVSSLCSQYPVSTVIVHNPHKKELRVVRTTPEQIHEVATRLLPWLDPPHEQILHLGAKAAAYYVRPSTSVLGVEDINSQEIEELLRVMDIAAIVVFGTGIIRSDILALPCPIINLHWGYSPYYRGSYTCRWALHDGHPEAMAVTLHLLDRGIDSGDILAQLKPELDGSESFDEIEQKVSLAGIKGLIPLIGHILNNCVPVAVRQETDPGHLFLVKHWNTKAQMQAQEKLNDGLVFDYLTGCRTESPLYDERPLQLSRKKRGLNKDEPDEWIGITKRIFDAHPEIKAIIGLSMQQVSEEGLGLPDCRIYSHPECYNWGRMVLRDETSLLSERLSLFFGAIEHRGVFFVPLLCTHRDFLLPDAVYSKQVIEQRWFQACISRRDLRGFTLLTHAFFVNRDLFKRCAGVWDEKGWDEAVIEKKEDVFRFIQSVKSMSLSKMEMNEWLSNGRLHLLPPTVLNVLLKTFCNGVYSFFRQAEKDCRHIVVFPGGQYVRRWYPLWKGCFPALFRGWYDEARTDRIAEFERMDKTQVETNDLILIAAESVVQRDLVTKTVALWGSDRDFMSADQAACLLPLWNSGQRSATVCARASLSREAMLLDLYFERFLRDIWKDAENKRGQVGLGGAGAHSEWLLGLLARMNKKPALILDDYTNRTTLHGVPVTKPSPEILETLDVVVISLDGAYRMQVAERLTNMAKQTSCNVVDPYAGLPTVPFMKQ